jgi:hypothetical protein
MAATQFLVRPGSAFNRGLVKKQKGGKKDRSLREEEVNETFEEYESQPHTNTTTQAKH